MQLDMFFPTPVWWEQTELDNTDMLKLCYQLHKEDDNGRVLSNQGGWQSKDFRPDVYAEMKPLYDMIMTQVDNCIRDYGYHEEYCYPIMENFWFNINKQGNTNSVHIHDNSFISGVYYLSAKPGQGNINVYNNNGSDWNTDVWTTEPKLKWGEGRRRQLNGGTYPGANGNFSVPEATKLFTLPDKNGNSPDTLEGYKFDDAYTLED